MDPSSYTNLVSRLEDAARTRPRTLRWQMFLMIAVGYGYVLMILGVVLAALGLSALMLATGKVPGLAFKLLVPLGGLAWLIARSVWVQTAPPTGKPMEPGQAPALTRRIEEIRSALRAPRADSVLFTSEFNASVTQIPRLGIFGWPRTYLVLGLPLMLALDRVHFDAVLAHEFAHLSGSHPKRGLWVYRMSQTWQQLLTQLHETRNWARFLFQSFVEWYVPRLEAYGLVLSRRDEYAADADAARVTSAAAMGEALAISEMRSPAVATFWEDIWARVEKEQAPPAKTWSVLPSHLRQDVSPPTRHLLLERALTRRTDENDTHPSLAERLRALGLTDAQTVNLSIALDQSAAEHYLGDMGRELLDRFEGEWNETVDEVWRASHAQAKKDRARMEALLARDRGDAPLTRDELWELGLLVAQLESEPAAEPYYRRLVAQMPDHVPARFRLGSRLLANGDPAGISHIEHVMAQDPDSIPAGYEVLYPFYAERDDREGIARIRQTLYEHQQAANAAQAERAEVTRRDTFAPADLSPADLATLRAIGERDSRISRLWVARKLTTSFAHRPHLVVVVERRLWRLGSWGRNDSQLAQDVVGNIDLSIPCDYLVIVVGGTTAWLLKRLEALPDACIYGR
jgi:Zn-dependent protease with chaperone function